MSDIQQTGFGRVFLQENGAGPANPYSYQGGGRLGSFTHPKGSVTPVRGPSASSYDEFDVVGGLKGEAALPTTSFIVRLAPRSRLLRIVCPFDIQAHYGRCTTPSDFKQWIQAILFEQASLTQLSGSELTALDEPERALVTITGEITAQRIWYLDNTSVAVVAGDAVTDEVIGVAMDQRVLCGECGVPSDGTQRMFAVVKRAVGTSPGLPAEILASEDGGATWDEYIIDTLAYDEDPSGFAIIGNYAVIVSNDSGSLHYAPLDDLEDGWTEVTEGFEVAGPPNAIFALNPTAVWIVGDGGYVYFSEDITAGVQVQSAGTVTGQNLYKVHAVDENNVLACGADSAVIYSQNGGTTWNEAGDTGLPVGATFWACRMRSDVSWLVGGTGGLLYYTTNGGVSWSAKAFPGSGTGTIYDLAFSLHPASPCGFMAHTPATGRGKILRTIDGGFSWAQIPEGATPIPNNSRLTCLAVCRDPNVVMAGGLSANGTDGILLVGS